MFGDMGTLNAAHIAKLDSLTIAFLRDAISQGSYVGFLVSPNDDSSTVVAGAGVQLRQVMPFPWGPVDTQTIARGHEAIVLNVYTESAYRRFGLARLLMEHIIVWARESHIESLVLRASTEGLPLYEQLGFVQTNEMRLSQQLLPEVAR